MVRDESSDGQRQRPEPDSDTSHTSISPFGRSTDTSLGTGDLTQELARLLAATIAHNQAQRGIGGGLPTGSDLASLASLMQAASAHHRSLSPTFKDGLSALSYAQPHANHTQAGPGDRGDPHHDDEPMPIPSTWREPVATERDRWFRQQMGAAVLGLAAGLMIVIPTVLYLSGWIGGGGQKQNVAAAASTSSTDFAKSPEIKTVKVRPVDRQGEAAQVVTGTVDSKTAAADTRQTESAVTIATARTDAQRARTEELLAFAQRRIDNGDVLGAREMLAGADAQAMGPATFALAETYDPNMLAAWGTRGVAADVPKARALYDKALGLGVGKAQLRLDGLR